MHTHPLVSILIPTYNQKPEYLRSCINSAINQTYKNIEVIVSNNWSTDEQVEAVISEFMANENFVTVKPDSFLPMIDNFCFAADQAKGGYISFLSSDDLLEHDAIELLVESLLKNKGTKLAFGEVEHVKAVTLKHIKYARGFELAEGNYTAREFLKYYEKKTGGIWMLGNLIEKEEYYAIGGIKSGKLYTSHDISFLFKWLNKKNSIAYVNKLVGKFRVWEDANQKGDGKRDKRNVLDLMQVYNIILDSEYVVSIMGRERVVELQHNHAEILARYWSIMRIRGELTNADFEEVKTLICNTYTNFRIKFYFLCCKPPLNYFFLMLIKIKDLFKVIS